MLKREKILAIVVGWVLAGILIGIYDHFTLQSHYASGTTSTYSFGGNLLLNASVGFAAALTGGSFLVLFVNERFRDRSYWQSILLVAGSFVVVSSFLVILVTLIQTALSTGRAMNWPSLKSLLLNSMHIKNILIWGLVVVLTQFILQINDKFGQGVLYNLVIGRYHQPREETRIFMFVDLMSSTAIAEKLKNDRYHLFLRDFFADITNSILYNKGEIYQYVGDEIVISWKPQKNQFDNSCLQCYFDMRTTIASLSERYEEQYGLVPDFKVGLHYGKVIAGEIGVIKRDITFSGDVLNTTSRIQSKCNEYSVKILTSDELLRLLPYSTHYNRIPIGNVVLKGKSKPVALSTLRLI